MSETESANRLLQHLQADDFATLNNDQRIILASHRFAPEVTSAVLWLNEKAPSENLITCVQLIPYHDSQLDALFVQASTIIPMPGIDNYVVRVGSSLQEDGGGGGGSLGEKLTRTFARNREDEVTPFLRRVGDVAISGLSDEIRPDKRSRWGGGNPSHRYYHLWYSAPPWSNWGMSYHVNLYPSEAGEWLAEVAFRDYQDNLKGAIADINLHAEQDVDDTGVLVRVGRGTLGDDFGNEIAAMVRRFIENITPVVNALKTRVTKKRSSEAAASDRRGMHVTESGFTEKQAETLAAEHVALLNADLATKADLRSPLLAGEVLPPERIDQRHVGGDGHGPCPQFIARCSAFLTMSGRDRPE